MTTATAPPPAKQPKAAALSPAPAAPAPISFRPPRQFKTAAEWLDSLGGVPLERIIFDPWPGTATEEDLLYLVAHDSLCELIDGTLVEKPVGMVEGFIEMRLGSRLTVWAEANRAGFVGGSQTTLRMANGRIRLPDIVFLSRDQLPGGKLPAETIPTLPPTLAVEVYSKTNTAKEIAQKLEEYFASGGRLAWVVYPKTKTIKVHDKPGPPVAVLGESDTLDGGAVLPGFSLLIAELFDEMPTVK